MARTQTLAASHRSLDTPTIETAQLRLRAPRRSDLEALFAIQGDRVAMRYSWCAPDLGATARHVEGYASRFAEDGYAPWTALDARRRKVVGWGGLAADPFDGGCGVEVSYFFHPDVWGRGFATELVGASLALAFEELVLPAVGATTRPQNAASIRVLEKSGFARVCAQDELGRAVYRIQRADWLAGRTSAG